MDEQEQYERIKKRVKEIKGFYQHLAAYAGVMLLLFVIDSMTGSNWWVFWPALGWGIGVAVHGISLYANPWGSEWESRKIRQLRGK